MLSPLDFAAPLAIALAQETKFKPVVELRTRFDRRLDRDLSEAVGDNRSAIDSRARVGFDFNNGKDVSGRFRWQYAHSLVWTATKNGSDESSDLYLGHIDFKTPSGTWSLGRQVLKYGGNRVFEESNFGQRSKSYDLLKFRNDDFDAFAGKVGYGANPSDQSKLVGGVARWSLGESLAYFKHDDHVTNADFWTLDHRFSGKLKNADWALEGALQRGRNAGRDVDAFWLHARVNYDVNEKTRLYAEANISSGGQSATKTRRFDARYGTPHATLGLVDVQGNTNLRHLELGVVYKPNKTSEFLASFHKFGLYDATDGWFGGTSINARPGGQFIDPTGASGSDVGSEFDLAGRWDLTKLDTVGFELGVFFPGSFVKAFNGAATRNHTWLAVYYTRKF